MSLPSASSSGSGSSPMEDDANFRQQMEEKNRAMQAKQRDDQQKIRRQREQEQYKLEMFAREDVKQQDEAEKNRLKQRDAFAAQRKEQQKDIEEMKKRHNDLVEYWKKKREEAEERKQKQQEYMQDMQKSAKRIYLKNDRKDRAKKALRDGRAAAKKEELRQRKIIQLDEHQKTQKAKRDAKADRGQAERTYKNALKDVQEKHRKERTDLHNKKHQEELAFLARIRQQKLTAARQGNPVARQQAERTVEQEETLGRKRLTVKYKKLLDELTAGQNKELFALQSGYGRNTEELKIEEQNELKNIKNDADRRRREAYNQNLQSQREAKQRSYEIKHEDISVEDEEEEKA